MERQLVASALAVMLGACATTSEYVGPPAVASATMASARFASAGDIPNAAAPSARWWDEIGDAQLTRLIDQALASAPEIDMAVARIDQAQARVERVRAEGQPRVGAAASAVQINAGEAPSPTLLPGRKSFSAYDAGLNAAWEIDLFGRARMQRNAAAARRDAAEASLADAQVALSAAIATRYIELRAIEAELRIREQSATRLATMEGLASARVQRGTATADAALNAADNHAAAVAQLALDRAALVVARNDLAALVGIEPGQLVLTPGDVPLPPAAVTIPDPATMLRNRPDIRIAERELAAASADKALAEAERFPRLSFFGLLGIGGSRIDGPLSAPSLLALAMPRLSLPIFDGGQIRAGIRQGEGNVKAATAQYRKTVLSVLRDCDNALARFGARRIVLAQAVQAEQSTRRQADLAAQRFKSGTATRDAVEAAEIRVDQARVDAVTARAALVASYVAVMKELGLGWQPR